MFMCRLRVGDDGEVGDQLDLAVAAELEVDRLVLAVGAEEAEVHRQPAAGADLLLDDRAGEDDLAARDRVVGALALLDAVDEDGERRFGARAAASPAARRRSCPSGSRCSRRSSAVQSLAHQVERRLVAARVQLLAPDPAAEGHERPVPAHVDARRPACAAAPARSAAAAPGPGPRARSPAAPRPSSPAPRPGSPAPAPASPPPPRQARRSPVLDVGPVPDRQLPARARHDLSEREGRVPSLGAAPRRPLRAAAPAARRFSPAPRRRPIAT